MYTDLDRRAGQASQGGCAFLDACAAGLPLARAGELAIGAQPDLDFTQLLACLVQAGAFRALREV